ncbi:ATP-binding protein [Frigoribacterium sp. UYMn621]|uniref:sensor histidine kinase n=1 Tax=Frigoribacterium sp. UYMn621 TaxID=3156343 RepID=UPI0033946349
MGNISGIIGNSDERRRERLRRSIAQSQLLNAAAMLLMTCFVVVVHSTSLADPLFLWGLALEFVATVVALLITWTERNSRWATLLPITNILAIFLIREGAPQLSAGLLFVLPVIWMSRRNGIAGTIGSVVLIAVLIWTGAIFNDAPTSGLALVGLFLLPMTLAFVATATYFTARHSASQRILLQQQAQLVERAFARASSQERLRNEILNAVNFGVIALDRNGLLILMNDAHQKSLSEFDAPAGVIVHPVVYGPDRVTRLSNVERPLARAIAGESLDGEIIWIGEPGSRREAFSVSSRPLTGSDGRFDGQVVVVRDVTRELDAIKARDDLVASVSHDLRTPITSILGYLELVLEDDEIDEESRKMVGIAHRNSERLFALVSDLMHAASESDPKPAMTFLPYDLSYTVDEAVESQRPMMEGQGLQLNTDIETPVLCVIDPLRIRQVLDNLLTNAVKYNSEHGEIGVTLHDDGSTVRIAVSDTGLGISDDDQKQLFQRFFRTETARLSSVHGSGLGLNISAEIIKEHGGELVVSSVVGVGSTFEITLPSLRNPVPNILTESSGSTR